MLTSPQPQQCKQTLRSLVFPKKKRRETTSHFVSKTEMYHFIMACLWQLIIWIYIYLTIAVRLEQGFLKSLAANPKEALRMARTHSWLGSLFLSSPLGLTTVGNWVSFEWMCKKWMKSWMNVYCWHGHSHVKDQCLRTVGTAKPSSGLSVNVDSVCKKKYLWSMISWSICAKANNWSFHI